MGAVIIYAGLALWQSCEAHKLATLAQKTFDASNRPYIGGARYRRQIYRL
jgi:hypothetical protein